MKITVVVPILNEAQILPKTLGYFRQLSMNSNIAEVLFSDSGSSDSSIKLIKAQDFTCVEKKFNGQPSIGKALRQARDLIESPLTLIHPVDVQITQESISEVIALAKSNPSQDCVICFPKQYDSRKLFFRLYELLVIHPREIWAKNFVWTNAPCISTSLLNSVSEAGFLEDVLFSDFVKSQKIPVTFTSISILVSSRRYIDRGLWRSLFINLKVMLSYRILGKTPAELKSTYMIKKKNTNRQFKQLKQRRSKMKNLITAAGLMLFSTFALGSGSEPVRNTGEYNLVSPKIGLKGFDPVSYFPEGGGQAAIANAPIIHAHLGVIYHFVSQANLDLFKLNPNKYEPTYGGWCAFAMAQNQKIDIDPRLFTINGRRLHLFISPEAKADFDANVAAFERRADINWKRISGESARK
jgi:glycosyltransferase involved in cell wall biosynthesis/YHS domain-containing protein